MSFVTDTLTPFLQASFYVFIMGAILLIVLLITRKNYPKWKAYFMHKILKKPYDEKMIQWTYGMIEQKKDKPKIIKEMLLANKSDYKIEQVVLIYDYIKAKGGVKHGK